MPDINGIPYVDSSDLVSAYPAVSLALATELDDQLGSKVDYPSGGADGDALIKSGTSAAWGAAGGLTLITSESFSAVSSVSINGCFTSAHANYRIMISSTSNQSGGTNVQLRFRASGSDNTNSTYTFGGRFDGIGGEGRLMTIDTNLAVIGDSANAESVQALDVLNPQRSVRTHYLSQSSAYGTTSGRSLFSNGVFFADTVFDGFSLLLAAGTFSGTIRIYGYRN